LHRRVNHCAVGPEFFLEIASIRCDGGPADFRAWKETAMAAFRWIGGLCVILMLSANTALCGQADSAALPVPPKQAARPARPMDRTCTGIDGRKFAWDQPNAPFAALCPFEDNAPAPPPPMRKTP
jgi:hypothetical protein